jgi:hypothetical protein
MPLRCKGLYGLNRLLEIANATAKTQTHGARRQEFGSHEGCISVSSSWMPPSRFRVFPVEWLLHPAEALYAAKMHQKHGLTPHRQLVEFSFFGSGKKPFRGHSEMASRDHGMVEFGVQIPMAP